ncbi:hypothetical protein KC317_g329, partial [Hortaea werneckii]
MVATRHSLPTTTSFTTTTTSSEPSTAEPAGPETYSKKQLALLKQLNIDAKDAILDGSRSGGGGGGEDGEEKQVYHYRGSVYEVVGNEPVEWLQQQPERWKRKTGGEGEGRDEGVQRHRGSGMGGRSRGAKRKRVFKSESAMKDEEAEERRVWKSPRKSAVNSVKRRRVSGDGYGGPQEVEDADTISVSMSRRRKNQSYKESLGKDTYMPANNPAPFSIAQIKENRAHMAVNEVLQLAAINSRIHTLAQQHKKMRQDLDILRHERESHSSHSSEPSKSLEIPDSEGSFADAAPPLRSTTTSSAEEPSTSHHDDTTTAATTTTRSLSTTSTSTTSSYATATSPSQPAPFSQPTNSRAKTKPDTDLPPPLKQQAPTSSSPPSRTPHPAPAPEQLPLTGNPSTEGTRKGQKKKKSWSFLTDLQRSLEEEEEGGGKGEYDRAEVG